MCSLIDISTLDWWFTCSILHIKMGKTIKKRDASIDVVAGIMLLVMMGWHITQWCHLDATWIIPVSFFMPWFFFKGGMMFKPKARSKVFSGGGIRLVKPFIVWTLAGYPLYAILLWLENDRNWTHYTILLIKQLLLSWGCSCNLALWFLLVLFAVRMAVNEIINNHLNVFVCAIIAIIIAYLLNMLHITSVRFLGALASGLFYFAMGYLLRNAGYRKTFVVTASIIYFIVLLLFPIHVDMYANNVILGNWLMWPIWSICGVIFFNAIFCALTKRFNVFLHAFAVLGENSMDYYVVHWLVLMATKIVIKYLFHIDDNIIMMYAMIMSISFMIAIITITNFRRKANGRY